jgi:hypothetical protein
MHLYQFTGTLSPVKRLSCQRQHRLGEVNPSLRAQRSNHFVLYTAIPISLLTTEPVRHVTYTREYLGWGVFALMAR